MTSLGVAAEEEGEQKGQEERGQERAGGLVGSSRSDAPGETRGKAVSQPQNHGERR